MADFFSKIDTTIMGRKTAAGWVKMRASGEMRDTPGSRGDGNPANERGSGPSLKPFVKKLKRRTGKDIYLGGGGESGPRFPAAGLVDELFIGVVPTLLGDGIPGFPPKFPQRDFTLTECKSYSNGSVGLRYERARTKARR